MRYQSRRPGNSRGADWLMPLVMAALAVGALLVLNSIQPEPIVAEVDEAAAIELEDGRVEVRIAWNDERAPGIRTQVVQVDPALIVDGKLPFWTERSRGIVELRFVDPQTDIELRHLATAAGIGALLGLVVMLSLRGYGYVRGNGEIGSMTRDEVREDRGFYWRS